MMSQCLSKRDSGRLRKVHSSSHAASAADLVVAVLSQRTTVTAIELNPVGCVARINSL
jgi:hypothetical protein